MNLKKLFSFLLLLFFFHSIALSQVQQEWVRRYPDTGSSSASANAMVLDDSSNVYISGFSIINSQYNYCTIRYNTNGVQQWVAQYPGISGTGRWANSIALDKFSNVYVTGISAHDFCTIKYNSNGVQQWVQFYDGPSHGNDEAERIAIDNAGNVYVSGYSDSAYLEFGYATIKYSADGRQLWVRRYNGCCETDVKGLIVDDSCNIYLTGVNNSRAVTIKYDSSGNQLWSQVFTGLGPPYATGSNSIVIDGNYNVYITGYTNGNQTYSDYFLIKYSSTGVLQFLRRFNADSLTNGSADGGKTIVLDNTGSIYIAGYAGGIYGSPYNFCTLKYSNTGDLIWVKRDIDTIGGGPINIVIDLNNNIFISGSASVFDPSVNTYRNAYELVMYNDSGIELSKQKYLSGSGDSFPYSIDLDKNNNIFETGISGNSMATIKYSQTSGLKKIAKPIPFDFILYQNYPNPFNSETKIKFSIPRKINSAELTIYDILGKKVTSLNFKYINTGVYEVSLDASNFSSGVYYYRLTIIDSFYLSITKKLVLLK